MTLQNENSIFKTWSSISHHSCQLWGARNLFIATSSGRIWVQTLGDNRWVIYHAYGHFGSHPRRCWHKISQLARRRRRYGNDQQTIRWRSRKWSAKQLSTTRGEEIRTASVAVAERGAMAFWSLVRKNHTKTKLGVATTHFRVIGYRQKSNQTQRLVTVVLVMCFMLG